MERSKFSYCHWTLIQYAWSQSCETFEVGPFVFPMTHLHLTHWRKSTTQRFGITVQASSHTSPEGVTFISWSGRDIQDEKKPIWKLENLGPRRSYLRPPGAGDARSHHTNVPGVVGFYTLYILTLHQYAASAGIFVQLKDFVLLRSINYRLLMLPIGGVLLRDRVKVTLAPKPKLMIRLRLLEDGFLRRFPPFRTPVSFVNKYIRRPDFLFGDDFVWYSASQNRENVGNTLHRKSRSVKGSTKILRWDVFWQGTYMRHSHQP